MYKLHLLYLNGKRKALNNNSNNDLLETFRNFQKTLSVRSPGRINMIGEHTDYNEGFVLPTAINRTIDLHFTTNGSPFLCNVFSRTYDTGFSFDLRKITKSRHSWENYILGVVEEIRKRGRTIQGFDCIIESNLPVGAGISSSAALEGGIAFGLNELFDLNLDRTTMAELSRDAEHHYVGTKCGIMDQYASILSKTRHLILLDCQSLRATYVPANFQGHQIILLNTMVSHSLADSEYNTRRQECEEVVALVAEKFPEVNTLRDVSSEVLSQFRKKIPNTLLKRASFVIQENARVLKAVEAVKQGDLISFGSLMYQSHSGLRNNYEVSCRELDFLVDLATKFKAVKGARMMGGGFGGCTINLVEEDFADDFIFKASEAYEKEFKITPEAIRVSPAEGTHLIP